MKTELFREGNCLFPQNDLGDPTFLFYLFEENTTLHDISKFEEFCIIQFSNIPINSLSQFDFSRFTGSVLKPDLSIISLLSTTLKSHCHSKCFACLCFCFETVSTVSSVWLRVYRTFRILYRAALAFERADLYGSCL